jgi:hypothetical protein
MRLDTLIIRSMGMGLGITKCYLDLGGCNCPGILKFDWDEYGVCPWLEQKVGIGEMGITSKFFIR